MAWESLISAVTGAITSNGNNEITGSVLRNLINNNLIPLLGVNRFKGLATPSTNPPSEEHEVYYFASDKGVYSNFGGLELLSNSLHVIIRSDDSDAWVAYDMNDGLNAQHELLSSLFHGYRARHSLRNGDLVADKNITQFTNDAYLSGTAGEVRTSADTSAANGYSYTDYIEVIPNKQYTYVGFIWADYRLAVYDEDFNVVQTVANFGGFGTGADPLNFTTKNNAKFIRCTVRTQNIDTFTLKYTDAESFTLYAENSEFKELLNSIKWEQDQTLFTSENVEIFENSYIHRATGNQVAETNGYSSTGFIPVRQGQFEIQGGMFQDRGYAFYDENQQYLYGSANFGATITTPVIINADSRVKFLRTTVQTSQLANFKIIYRGLTILHFVSSEVFNAFKKKTYIEQNESVANRYSVGLTPNIGISRHSGSAFAANGMTSTDAVSLNPSSEYRYTGALFSDFGMAFFDKDDNYIGGKGWFGAQSGVTVLDFETPPSTAYGKFNFRSANIDDFNVQFLGEDTLAFSSGTVEQLENTIKGADIVQKINNQKTRVSAPAKLFITEGNRLEIFKTSIVQDMNPNNFSFFIKDRVGFNVLQNARFYDRKFIYDAAVGDPDVTINLAIQDSKKTVVSETGNIDIIVSTKKGSPTTQKNFLICGDSFVHYGYKTLELQRRLTENTVVDGIQGDGLNNINFVGSKTSNNEWGATQWAEASTDYPGTYYQEGFGGKHYKHYAGNQSIFWNPNTGALDIDYYCQNRLINPVSQLDAVYLILGTNDFNTVGLISSEPRILNLAELKPFIRTLLDAFIAHNPNIKIIVSGRILPTPKGGGGYLPISRDNQYFFSNFNQVWEWNRMVEEICNETAYQTNTLYVDPLITLDTDFNMPYATERPNLRNSTDWEVRGDDNVHPARSGSCQIADAWYHATHHFIL